MSRYTVTMSKEASGFEEGPLDAATLSEAWAIARSFGDSMDIAIARTRSGKIAAIFRRRFEANETFW